MKIQNAFRIGLLGTLGVGVGLLIITSIANLSTIITYIGAALFLALGLDPAISWLERRGLPRWAAILIVMTGVGLLVAALILAVAPIIVEQVSQFVEEIPRIVELVSSQQWIDTLKEQFPQIRVDEVIEQVTTGLTEFVTNPDKLSELAGGVLLVAVAIGSGVFAVIIVFILMLYFTASLNAMKRATYQLVPASKRERFADLTEQITQSVGRFVLGQTSLAAVNGVLSFIFLSIINAPFPAVLAFLAFLFSLVPLVGTLTGSVIIVLVCWIPGLGSPLTALVARDLLHHLHAGRGIRAEPAHHEPRREDPERPRRDRRTRGRRAAAASSARSSRSRSPRQGLLIIKQVVIPRQNER